MLYFDDLAKEFAVVNKRLQQAIYEQSEFDEIRSIDIELNDTLQKVRDYRPTSLGELRKKLKFFVDELTFEQRDCRSFALKSIAMMLDTDFSYQMHSPFASLEKADISGVCCEKSKLINAYELVAASNDRISIIDVNYRYVNTSQKNGQFYDSIPNSVVGRHVSDLIGQSRFENRAQKFLDRCFDGKRQQYFHTLEIGKDTRIMSCHMMPLSQKEGTPFGAMVAMNDITELVTCNDSIILETI